VKCQHQRAFSSIPKSQHAPAHERAKVGDRVWGWGRSRLRRRGGGDVARVLGGRVLAAARHRAVGGGLRVLREEGEGLGAHVGGQERLGAEGLKPDAGDAPAEASSLISEELALEVLRSCLADASGCREEHTRITISTLPEHKKECDDVEMTLPYMMSKKLLISSRLVERRSLEAPMATRPELATQLRCLDQTSMALHAIIAACSVMDCTVALYGPDTAETTLLH
jgi:hypothetical protein